MKEENALIEKVVTKYCSLFPRENSSHIPDYQASIQKIIIFLDSDRNPFFTSQDQLP